MTRPQLLKSDGFSTSMNLKPLSGDCARGVFCQNGLAKSFPLGSHSGTLVRCIAREGTYHASVHMFAQANGQLAARAPTDVSSSASSGLLLVVGLPSDLPGKGDHQRVGWAGPSPYCRVASASAADRSLLELADPVVVVCGSSHRHAAPPGGWGVLSGGR